MCEHMGRFYSVLMFGITFFYLNLKEVVKMAVPKRKVSKARRDKRRSNVWKLEIPGFTKCPKCGEYNLSHRVCRNCKTYAGKDYSKPEVKAEEAKA